MGVINKTLLLCIWIVSCFYAHPQSTILNTDSSGKDCLSITLKKINEDLTDSLYGDYILIGGAFPYRGCYYPKLDSIQMAKRLNSFFILKFDNKQLLLNDIGYTAGRFIINNTIKCNDESTLKITSLLQSIDLNNIKTEKDIGIIEDFVCLIAKNKNNITKVILKIDEKENKSKNKDSYNLMELFWLLREYKLQKNSKIKFNTLFLPNKYPWKPYQKLELKSD